MTSRLNRWLLILLVLVGVPFYWLLIDNGPSNVPPKPLSMAELREAASGVAGASPTAIAYETVAHGTMQRNLTAAGTGIRLMDQAVQAFRVEFPGERPIAIDTGITESEAQHQDYEEFDAMAQSRVSKAADEARLIILLANGPPHDGGLSEPGMPIPEARRSRIVGQQRRQTGPYAVEPGVVVIPMADVGAQHRLVYVRLKDGEEFLFAGAIASSDLNWREVRAPARLMTDYVQPQDREPLLSWLRTVRRLKDDAPDLHIVPLHELPAKSGLQKGFPKPNGAQ